MREFVEYVVLIATGLVNNISYIKSDTRHYSYLTFKITNKYRVPI